MKTMTSTSRSILVHLGPGTGALYRETALEIAVSNLVKPLCATRSLPARTEIAFRFEVASQSFHMMKEPNATCILGAR